MNTFRCLFLIPSVTVRSNEWYCDLEGGGGGGGLETIKTCAHTHAHTDTPKTRRKRTKEPLVACYKQVSCKQEVGVNYYSL